MATAFSITKYRDPEKLDISVLGKAMQYKQQMYDTNVAQVQQLVNQYAGTDLLRDVDKQYFGERLNTIVNYINESGTRDWSRKSVASDIQNYVSQALDRNVLSAIGSTQARRKQMAEIEDIKKNKPDQYSMQNEWFATQDYQRYMTSGQVGDSYRAQSYVPYTDVKALLLENSKYLKDFGVEYHVDPIGGNQYFTKIGTSERIAPETAKEYLDMMMDSKVQNQLYIDGQYAYKDLPSESIKKQYDDKLNGYNKYNNERINELKTQALTATRTQKAQIEQAIQKLEDSNNNINKTKSMNISRDAMANYLYNSDFKDKWSDFLSYDRLKDWKIDDTGFKIWEAEQKTQQQAWENQFKVDSFNYQAKKDEAEFQQRERKMQQDLTIAGWKQNKDGSLSLDPNNPVNGMNVTKSGKTQEDITTESGFLAQEKAYNQNATLLNNEVVKEIEELLQRPENAEIKKQLGNNVNAKQAAWMMVNSPSKYGGLYALISDTNKGIVDDLQSNKKALNDFDKNLEAMTKDAMEMGRAMASKNTKASTQRNFVESSLGYIIDSKGNVVKGDVLNAPGKNGDLARTITTFNYALMSGDLTDVEAAKYRRAAKNALIKSGLSQKQAQDAYEKMVYKTGYSSGVGGYFKQVANEFAGAVLQAGQGIANNIFLRDTTDKSTMYDDFKKSYLDGESFKAKDKFQLGLRQSFSTNSRPGDLGNSDVDRSKLSFDPSLFKERAKQQMTAIDKKADVYKQIFNKTVNIDLGSKLGQSMLGSFKAHMEVGDEIQEKGNAQILIDQTTNMAQLTLPVKDGKEYVAKSVSIPIDELPQAVLQNIKPESTTKIYSADNPYSVNFEARTEIPTNREEWNSKIELMPDNERTKAFNNPPRTQQDWIRALTVSYGNEIVEKNKEAINKILDLPIEISTQRKDNQWTLIVKQNDKPIFMQDTGQKDYNPKDMRNGVNDIVTTAIEQRIKDVLGIAK